jgi:hypothetical protein
MAVTRLVVTFTIPAGEFLSAGVDCSEGYLGRVQFPAAWTPANLSFLISHDNITYYDLVDRSGMEALLPVVAGAATMIRVEPWSTGIGWWKLRSGPRASPVKQAEARTFTVTLAPPGQ